MGVFYLIMFGQNLQYGYLDNIDIQFPHFLNKNERLFLNEREFIEFLLRNDYIQRKIGIKMDGSSNGLFPDIKGEIYDGSGIKIRVEVEYKAINYVIHKHPYRGCDLILSFIRQVGQRFLKGCPIWSFYVDRGESDRYLEYTLNDDINHDFDKPDELYMESEGKFIIQ